MPIGSFEAVPTIVSRLLERRPQRVLDAGLGFGFWGSAVRTWLDLGVRPWKTYLVGVEGWSGYRNPAWDLYDLIFEQPLETFLGEHAATYDFVIAGDILEHFTREAGCGLLAGLRRRVAPGGTLVISTPGIFFEQGAVYGNAYEVHRSFWSPDELRSEGYDVTFTDCRTARGMPTTVAEWRNELRG